MTDCCEKKAEARRHGMFEGPVGDDWFDCDCKKKKPPVPKVLIFSTFPLPDWIMQHIDFGGAETRTYDEFVTRWVKSEPEFQDPNWKVTKPTDLGGSFVHIDFGEIEARIIATLARKADDLMTERQFRELAFNAIDHRPKGDARELIKEAKPVPPTKFTLSRREQLAQQRRDAKRRR